MRVAIVGTGYVGLVTGACFAEFGHFVTCVDKDDSKIARLNKGECPIYEPGLDTLLYQGQKSGRLKFTTDLTSAVNGVDAVFLAVGTPSNPLTGEADLEAVFAAAEQIARALTSTAVLVTKSTVPVGTARKISAIVKKTRPDLHIYVASNPEFLREGAAITDFMRPDRVIIGTDDCDNPDHPARVTLQQLYRPLYLIETPLVFTNIETAEIIKYAANAFLATKVAFINEIADICEQAQADVQDVAKGIGLDGRIGRKFLHAGPGFGGSCFPKDIKALAFTAQQFKTPSKIVEAVIASNEGRKTLMSDRIVKALGGTVSGKRIGILGVTFKPNTDDMRDAPSLAIIPTLLSHGADVIAYDPVGQENAHQHFDISWGDTPYEVAKGADALVILTEWNEFRAMDLAQLHSLMRNPLLLDFRNIYKSKEVVKYGFDYISIGRPRVNATREEPLRKSV